MKKVNKIVIVFLMVMIISIPSINFAMETNDYTMEDPTGFSNTLGENILVDADGNSINVIVQDNTDSFDYTQEFLDQLTDEIKNNIDAYRQAVADEVKAQYANSGIDEAALNSYIQQVVSKMEYKDFLVKELTTCSKNQYKCFHFISEISLGEEQSTFTETYQIASGKKADKIYTITISSNDKTFFENEKVKEAINSFTIKDYEEPAVMGMNQEVENLQTEIDQLESEANTWSKVEKIGWIIAGVGFGIAIVGIIIKLTTKKKEGKKE